MFKSEELPIHGMKNTESWPLDQAPAYCNYNERGLHDSNQEEAQA
jgi:hypothetical protein